MLNKEIIVEENIIIKEVEIDKTEVDLIKEVKKEEAIAIINQTNKLHKNQVLK